jgi:hypothetical protein
MPAIMWGENKLKEKKVKKPKCLQKNLLVTVLYLLCERYLICDYPGLFMTSTYTSRKLEWTNIYKLSSQNSRPDTFECSIIVFTRNLLPLRFFFGLSDYCSIEKVKWKNYLIFNQSKRD